MRYLLDTNIWLALSLKGHTHHAPAMAWLDAIPQEDTLFFCRATQQSLLRLLSTEAVMRAYNRSAMPNRAAWEVQRGWSRNDRVYFAEESPDLELRWEPLACLTSASPKLWMDAYLAAFAETSGYRLVTTDKAFRQFDGLDLLLIGA